MRCVACVCQCLFWVHIAISNLSVWWWKWVWMKCDDRQQLTDTGIIGVQIFGGHELWHKRTFTNGCIAQHKYSVCERREKNMYSIFDFILVMWQHHTSYLYGPLPGLDVLLSRLDAKLHVADVRAELPGLVAVKCSVLNWEFSMELKCIVRSDEWTLVKFTWNSSWLHYCWNDFDEISMNHRD